MEEKIIYDINSSIPEEEFQFAHKEESIHDTKFETRPVGWLEDSVKRFAKNKASVVAAVIIVIIALFAIFVPVFSPKYHVSKKDFQYGFQDTNFKTVLPRIKAFKGSGFWDGTKTVNVPEITYNYMQYDDSNYNKCLKTISIKEERIGSTIYRTYKIMQDTYAVGTKEIKLLPEDYQALLDYENEKGISYASNPEANVKKSIVKPSVDIDDYINNEFVTWLEEHEVYDENSINNYIDKLSTYYNQNQNIYYKIVPTTKRAGKPSDTQFEPLLGSDGNVIDLYIRDSSDNLVFGILDNGLYTVRVDYYDYFTYRYGFEPNYVFGANQYGQDILLRLALGARFSLLLGIGISLINFLIGLVWGAVSGYFGGKVDLVMERVTDIIANVPTIIIMTIMQIQLTNNMELKAVIGTAGTIVLAILIAFIYNGWVGVASTTRMQFYRFKGQEYVLASRTLGARDSRLIFKHILPNAAGTLVTSSVLMIPGVIFSESSLSYLGIINFSTSGICSIGALLNEGQAASIQYYPHVLLFPAIVISLLMISFNLFGNGLRDAFNTTLRGSEE